jgi:pheromone shutdown protein TraB
MNNIIIYGENHNSQKEIRKINNQIRLRKPDFILHELLYEDKVLNKKQALSRLANCKEGSLCDPRLNKDLYQLSFDLNIPMIGIDLEITDDNLSLKDKFKLRETHMIEMINKYHKKGNIIVVVGDTHLRTIKTKILGEPLLYNAFKNKAKIIRSKFPEIK